MRRYAMSGVAALKNLSEQDRARLQHQHRATQHVAGPEGDKLGGTLGLICHPEGGDYDGGTATGANAIDTGTGATHGADG